MSFNGFDKKHTKSKKDLNTLITKLNAKLEIYAKMNNLDGHRAACRELKIPTLKSKCTVKQLSGYIGLVTERIKR